MGRRARRRDVHQPGDVRAAVDDRAARPRLHPRDGAHAGVGDFLVRKWPWLTLATLAGNLSVFAVLLVSLRALDVPASQVTVIEAFAAWALIRLIGSIPITPGGIGIIELGLTGALVGFGGSNARVVAAVLVYRFLTVVPTLTLGLLASLTLRRTG